MTSFLVPLTGLAANLFLCHICNKLYCVSGVLPAEQVSTGHLHFIVRVPNSAKKEAIHLDDLFFGAVDGSRCQFIPLSYLQ